MLARLYLKVKVYITNLLSECKEKTHALNEKMLFGLLYFKGFPMTLKTYLLPFSVFVYLNYIFSLDASIFTTIDNEKERKINSSSIFGGFYLNFRRKCWIHEYSWLSITWIFKKLNSTEDIPDIPEIKLSHWSLLSKTL